MQSFSVFIGLLPHPLPFEEGVEFLHPIAIFLPGPSAQLSLPVQSLTSAARYHEEEEEFVPCIYPAGFELPEL